KPVAGENDLSLGEHSRLFGIVWWKHSTVRAVPAAFEAAGVGDGTSVLDAFLDPCGDRDIPGELGKRPRREIGPGEQLGRSIPYRTNPGFLTEGIVPEVVQADGCGRGSHPHVEAIASPISIGVQDAVEADCMQWLMDVANEMEEPAEGDRPLAVGT